MHPDYISFCCTGFYFILIEVVTYEGSEMVSEVSTEDMLFCTINTQLGSLW